MDHNCLAARGHLNGRFGSGELGNARLKLRAWRLLLDHLLVNTRRHAPLSRSLGRNTGAKKLAQGPASW